MSADQTLQPRTELRPTGLSGRWRNRLDSVMDLVVADGGAVSGTYHTAVGGNRGFDAHPLTGFVRGDAVVFCVDFRPHGSLGTWAGHHLADGGPERLVTLWHLARPVPHPHVDVDLWQGLLAGADEFEREA
jgi:hypothetical protein